MILWGGKIKDWLKSAYDFGNPGGDIIADPVFSLRPKAGVKGVMFLNKRLL